MGLGKREWTLSFLGVYEDDRADGGVPVIRCCLPSGHTRTVRLTDEALMLLVEQSTEILIRRLRRRKAESLRTSPDVVRPGESGCAAGGS